jgi:hypothetical protein
VIELLKLCGFEEHEIGSELPRVEKAFNKLGITDEDIERGKQRLAKYYDIELKGVRKVFRLIVRELVNAMLVKEDGRKKLIYGFMAPGVDVIGSAVVTKSKEMFVIHHCWAFHIVVGCIFGKIVPILEAAEKKWLKAGVVAHCANVKSLVGPIVLGLFPKPDLLITSGLMCETAPKTLDLLHETYDIPVIYVETCHDRGIGEYYDEIMRTAALTAKSMKILAERIGGVVGFKITDDMLLEVQDAKGKLQNAFSKVRQLVASSDPLLLSPTHDNIWMCLNMLTLSIDDIAEAADAIDTLYEELQERVNKGIGVVEKGAPRIMVVLPAGQTDPRLEHLLCEVGIAAVVSDTSIPIPMPSGKELKDPYIKYGMGIALQALGPCLAIRIPNIVEGCKKYNIDGVLDRFHVGCRVVAGDALLIEEAVKKELGIPVLLLEWENFDPRVYNHEQYKRRLEVFKTMMTKKSR